MGIQNAGSSASGSVGRRSVLGAALAVGLLLCLFSAGSAQANSPIFNFETLTSDTQAGGHPDIEVNFEVGTRASQGYNDPCFCNDPKVVEARLPAGVIGNPHAAPTCTYTDFARLECPIETQVGVVEVIIYNKLDAGGGESGQTAVAPLYNVLPHPNQAGLLAFPAPFIYNPIFIELGARTGGDFGLNATTVGIQRFVPLYGFHQTLWGVPADPIHDPQRFANGFDVKCGFSDPAKELRENKWPAVCYEKPSFPSASPLLPFMSNPTTCVGPLTATLNTLAFDHGTDTRDTTYPAITGCEQLAFNPSLSAKPTSTATDSPSGIDVDLSVPQLQSPTTPSPSQIKATTVTLPEGFSLNANAADGKTACTDAEAKFGTEAAAECPEFAKVGTLSIDSSALPGPLPGSIYLGEPQPGNRYRLFLVADGFATHIKLAGSMYPDPATGQIVVDFPDLPQSPLTSFQMHFFGSERGVLATPTKCGKYPVRSRFTPWDDALATQTSTQFFTIDSGPGGTPCPGDPRPFAPSFGAGADRNAAGAHSPFTVVVAREDGNQNLAGLQVTTPPGFSARLRGVAYCPEGVLTGLQSSAYSGLAEMASPACPALSQVGTVVAAAGTGSKPLHVEGKVYLAGPYKGDPLSLVVVIPAVSGPYDLGNIATRVALDVNPVTAQVTATSDPFPQIIGGVPLRTRLVRINLDRQGFALNPTSCRQLAVDSTLFGAEGGQASLSSHFQVANCADLPFSPKLALKLKGGMRRTGHPAVKATLTARPGDANIAKTVVTLPDAFQLDQAHLKAPCTRVQFAAGACPAGSVLGTATAESPLLDSPLTGNVYLRTSSHRLPDLVVALEGQVDIEIDSRVDSVDGRLRTSFETVPDVPITRFVLDLAGAKKGLLINSVDLCRKAPRAVVKSVGQNGIKSSIRPRMGTQCSGGERPKRHSRNGA